MSESDPSLAWSRASRAPLAPPETDPDSASREMGQRLADGSLRITLPPPLRGHYVTQTYSSTTVEVAIDAKTSPQLLNQLLDRLQATEDEIRIVGPYDARIVDALVERGFDHESNDDLKTVELPDERTVYLPDLLVEALGVTSRSEARRTIMQGGVTLDDEVLSQIDLDPLVLDGRILRFGRRRAVRIVKHAEPLAHVRYRYPGEAQELERSLAESDYPSFKQEIVDAGGEVLSMTIQPPDIEEVLSAPTPRMEFVWSK